MRFIVPLAILFGIAVAFEIQEIGNNGNLVPLTQAQAQSARDQRREAAIFPAREARLDL